MPSTFEYKPIRKPMITTYSERTMLTYLPLTDPYCNSYKLNLLKPHLCLDTAGLIIFFKLDDLAAGTNRTLGGFAVCDHDEAVHPFVIA
ncbi:hypothetical protein M378DRAFT_421834 [Amanita muscaria Koide BX008]|uniref:Uncharacterized protein n=1 Tax=Amanita muscaria (strain Koide BX008) TaxID=946122 RepID=A0A0C2W7G0_AMAMK|nr:hypothetical protein M378DRAFT_421834 [Amanita muscaria Koide BX008]